MPLVLLDRFRFFIQALNAIVCEAIFEIDSAGISVRVVDAANVAIVVARFPCVGLPEGRIGVDVAKLKSLLPLFSCPGIDLEITRQGKEDFLTIRSESSPLNASLSLKRLDHTTVRKPPNPPTINLPCLYEVSGADLWTAVSMCAYLSEMITFVIEDGRLELSAKGETDHGTVELPPAPTFEPVPAHDKRSSILSLDYLKDICRAMKDAGIVTIHMSDDHPIRFDCTHQGIEVMYMLAPRIEAD